LLPPGVIKDNNDNNFDVFIHSYSFNWNGEMNV